MRKSFLSAALLMLVLLSFGSAAQVPLRQPRPSAATGEGSASAIRPATYSLAPVPRYVGSGHPGSYRLADGIWHTADIGPTGQADRVLMRPEGIADFVLFLPHEIAAYAVQGDTFVTLPPFVRRRHRQLVPTAFAHRTYHDGGYEVLLYDGTPPTSSRYAAPTAPTLLPLAPVDAPVARHDNSDLFNSIFSPRTYYSVFLRHDGIVQELPVQRAAYHRLMLSLLADDPIVCAQLRAAPRMSCWAVSELLTAYVAHQREARLRAQR
ncbi:MAG: hypothetical protein M3Y12_00620 [Bacteroidota bacterium]|nr:hypothetical protein [Bacteroidota bacterium]